MRTLFVVNNTDNWPLDVPGVEVIPAEEYLLDKSYSESRRIIVFNLCASYKYQTSGYYVSLLAAARGHRHMPDISVIQGMRSSQIVRHASEDLDDLIQKSLSRIQSDNFTLSIYFGRNMAKTYDRLCKQLFNIFRAPLLRAHFVYDEKWHLGKITTISGQDIPDDHKEFLVESAQDYFSKPRFSPAARRHGRFNLAILYNPDEKTSPSDEGAIKKMVRAAKKANLEPEIIDRDSLGRIAEFDALFIRETTSVEHYTFRFAQRAAAEGLVVIDDPLSIMKCANKVYLAELLSNRHILTPRTVIVSEKILSEAIGGFNYPVILKQPDSSFSQGVVKVTKHDELVAHSRQMFRNSELLIIQEFTPTDFDWRVGVLDGKLLFVCKYYMAHKHWQIIKTFGTGRLIEGKWHTISVEDAPPKLIDTALAASKLIGDGLYGVDIKEINGKFLVIEINDNPNIESGCEDQLLKDELYNTIMRSFVNRIEKTKEMNRL